MWYQPYSILPQFSSKYIPKVRTGTFLEPLQSLFNQKYLSLNYKDLLSVCDILDISVTEEMAEAIQQATP